MRERFGSIAGIFAFVLLLGCEGRTEDPVEPPGTETRDLCERACVALSSCGGEDDGCVDACLRGAPPDALLGRCVDCLETVDCRGLAIGCQQGPACNRAWDLRVSGTGLEALEGRTARVLVVEAFEGEHWVDFAREVPIVGGGFDVTIEGGQPAWGIPFDVVVLVDVDGDGSCDPQVDRAWRVELGLPTGDAHVQVEGASAESPDECVLWDEVGSEIVLAGAGLEPWEGKTVIAAPVWVGRDFLTVGRYASAPIVQGRFRVRLSEFGDYVEDMAPDSEIRTAWMVDLDGDWICSAADAGGQAVLPPPGGLEQRVDAAPAAPGTAPCEVLRGMGFDLHLDASGYDDFEGLAIRATLVAPDDVAAGWARAVVEGGSFALDFPRAAIPGRPYRAALWIDVDGSERCEAPPDGAWMVEVGAVAGDERKAHRFDPGAADGAACAFYAF